MITIVNENKASGIYSVKFNGSTLSSGIFSYKIQAGAYETVRNDDGKVGFE